MIEVLEFFDLCKAPFAYLFAAEYRRGICAFAEKTAGGVFAQNDLVLFDEYFNGVTAFYIHLGSHFLGNDYASKLVYVAYDSCCFHNGRPFLGCGMSR